MNRQNSLAAGPARLAIAAPRPLVTRTTGGMILLAPTVWGSFLFSAPASTVAAEAEWRVGVARVCITPQQPVWLYGYAGQDRFRPFAGVLDDIYAKALAIQSVGGRTAVLIAADLCVLREPEETELGAILMRRSSANNLLSGDYPNYARLAVERQYPGVETLFVQGCGADANPEPAGRLGDGKSVSAGH